LVVTPVPARLGNASVPNSSGEMRQINQETKQRTFRLLFDLLTSKDAEAISLPLVERKI
jgi:hypothetical protein